MPQGPIPVANVPAGSSSAEYTTNVSSQAKLGWGALTGIVVNAAGTGSTITLYDGTSASDKKLMVLATATLGVVNMPPVRFVTGLFVVTAGSAAADVTVLYT